MAITKHIIGALALALAAAVPAAADEQLAKGEQLYQLCAQCHGAEGGGRTQSLAPAIAGLDAWYVDSSLKKFRSGGRGAHPDDRGGLRMYPMAVHFDDDEDIAALSAYVASMPRVQLEPTLEGGDASKGAAVYGGLCNQCHGAEGKGVQAMSGAPLAGASDWYLLESLKKFKAGIRGGNPAKDPMGAMMVGFANQLADEQAMKDVIAHIMTLSK